METCKLGRKVEIFKLETCKLGGKVEICKLGRKVEICKLGGKVEICKLGRKVEICKLGGKVMLFRPPDVVSGITLHSTNISTVYRLHYRVHLTVYSVGGTM